MAFAAAAPRQRSSIFLFYFFFLFLFLQSLILFTSIWKARKNAGIEIVYRFIQRSIYIFYLFIFSFRLGFIDFVVIYIGVNLFLIRVEFFFLKLVFREFKRDSGIRYSVYIVIYICVLWLRRIKMQVWERTTLISIR